MNEWNVEADCARQRLRHDLADLAECVAKLRSFAILHEWEAHDEPIRELNEFARSDDAPPDLRRVQERVDRGELSWSRVLEGKAGGLVDPRAGAFIAERLADLAMVGRAIRSGIPPDEAAAQVTAARRRTADAGNEEST